jgi:hypothetical protein
MSDHENNSNEKLNPLDLPEESEDSELDEIDKEIMEMGFLEDDI